MLSLFLTASFSFAQIRPIDKVYIVEGIVTDRETLIIIPSAILYNDSLGIMTTSDERGYYKIVVPVNWVQQRRTIPLNVVKTGYKRLGWGIGFHPPQSDTNSTLERRETMEVWNYDVQILMLAKNESSLSSTSMAHIPMKEGVHGYPVIKLAFENAVQSELRSIKLAHLKEGNEKVCFLLNGQIAFATTEYDLFIDNKLTFAFINGKKVKLPDINKLAKRSDFIYDETRSGALTIKYGKDTYAFVTNSQTSAIPEKDSQIK